MGIFTDDMHTAAWNKGLATKTKDCNLYEWSVERYNSHSDLKNVELYQWYNKQDTGHRITCRTTMHDQDIET